MSLFRYPNILKGILAAGVLFILTVSSPASEASVLKDLPKINLKKCTPVEKFIGRNPLSPLPNHFVLITQYEEKDNAFQIRPQGGQVLNFMNLYLITAFYVPEGSETGIVRDSSLVVLVGAKDAKASTEIINQWIMVDENGDFSIDRALFQQTVTKNGKETNQSDRKEFPSERIQDFQSFYEHVAESLNNKAKAEVNAECRLS